MFMPMVVVMMVMFRLLHGTNNHFGFIPDLLGGAVSTVMMTSGFDLATGSGISRRASTMAMAVMSSMLHVT